jgi:16S rRNA C1402 (ribose-2'-O) methylase RsmI
LVKRPIFVSRELTKVNEELVAISNISEIANIKCLGEFVIAIDSPRDHHGYTVDAQQVIDIFGRMTELAHIDADTAVKLTAAQFNIPATTVKNLAKKARFAAKRAARSVP